LSELQLGNSKSKLPYLRIKESFAIIVQVEQFFCDFCYLNVCDQYVNIKNDQGWKHYASNKY